MMPWSDRRLALAAGVGLLVLTGCQQHTVSGAVAGAIADGVVITLRGAANATTTTAGGGLYSISGLSNGDYTLTPSLPGYTFDPASISVTVHGDLGGLDFTAIARGGTLDASFGTGGKVTTAFGTMSDVVASVAIQADARIVVAGSTQPGLDAQTFALARYHVDGSLDPDFGGGGKVTTPFGTGRDGANAVAIQADGRIVAAGGAFSGTSTCVFALARYESDGSLDATFGAGGKVTTAFGAGCAYAVAVAIQADGKIVAAGHSEDRLALVRYDTAGALDAGFGSGGRVTTAFGPGSAAAFGVAIQEDGRIVAAGDYEDGTRGFFALARYQPDGSLDTSFGTAGTVTTAISDWEQARAVRIQTDGKIVATGYSATRSFPATQHNLVFALARYQPDGTLDTAFGTGGKVTTRFDTGRDPCEDIPYALAVQADGRIAAAGFSLGTSDAGAAITSFALARYDTDGSLDTTFGSGGKVTTRIGSGDSYAEAWALAIQADGRIVAVGRSGGSFALARYWP